MRNKAIYNFHSIILLFNRIIGKKINYNIENIIYNDYNLIKFSFNDKLLKCINYNLIDNFYLKNHFNLLGESIFDCSNNNDNSSISWHKDPNSSFFWESEKLSSRKIFIKKDGLDVKYVWELGRMNYLPQIALAFYASGNNKYLNKVLEIINDFDQNNKCDCGIQWACPMDVAIRAINIIISISIVKSKNYYAVNEKIMNNIALLLKKHQSFIYNNLEINFRKLEVGNHYLTDIVGLLYISYFLNDVNKFKFSSRQIVLLSKEQFFDDGVYFEKSTNYHRLAVELYMLGFALISKRKKIAFPKTFEKSINFIKNISYQKNHVIQLGDNDSGRIVKLISNGYIDGKDKFIENVLDYSDIFDSWWSLKNEDNNGLYSSFFNSIFETKNLVFKKEKDKTHFNNQKLFKEDFKYHNEFMYNFKINLNDLELIDYYNLGLIIIKNKELFFSFKYRGTKIRNCGHIHNDIFSYNLINDGKVYLLDPGSYCYNGYEEKRKMFKSCIAHGLPDCCKDFYKYESSFSMNDNIHYDYLKLSKNEIVYMAKSNNGIAFSRTVKFLENGIKILDESNVKMDYKSFNYYSRGYGIIEEANNNVNI